MGFFDWWLVVLGSVRVRDGNLRISNIIRFQAFHNYKILSSFKTVDYNCKNVRTEQKWKRWTAKKKAPIFSLGQAQILATWSSGLRGFCGAFIVPLFADWTAQVQLKWAWSGPFLQPFGAKWSQSFRQHYRFIPYKMLPKNAIKSSLTLCKGWWYKIHHHPLRSWLSCYICSINPYTSLISAAVIQQVQNKPSSSVFLQLHSQLDGGFSSLWRKWRVTKCNDQRRPNAIIWDDHWPLPGIGHH